MASSCEARCDSRLGSGSDASVLSWPLARWLSRLPSAWIKPQPVVPRPGSKPRILGKLLQLLVGDVVIAPDGLDVVILFERIDQLHQRRRVVAGDGGFILRLPAELDRLGLAERALQRLGDFVQGVDRGPDFMAVLVALDVVGAGLDRGFQHLLL